MFPKGEGFDEKVPNGDGEGAAWFPPNGLFEELLAGAPNGEVLLVTFDPKPTL